tara:strand:+ start:1219 stop:1497 length:279 start_codon:yes stop_codon:yes gene_type:complete
MWHHNSRKDSCHVTFKVEGEHFEMLDYVHQKLGITKTRQMLFLLAHLVPIVEGKDNSKEYIDFMAGIAMENAERKPFKGTASEVKKELDKYA